MSANTLPAQLASAAKTGEFYINDPGDGKTLILSKNFAVCQLTIGTTAETRLIPTAVSVGPGFHLYVVANEIGSGGSCTITGTLASFTAEGQVFHLVTAFVNSAVAWTSGESRLTGTDTVINSTNEMNIAIGGVSVLAIDDAAIAGNAAVAGQEGKDVYIETQDGGAATTFGYAGADLSLGAGVGSAAAASSTQNGADSGSLTLFTQAGGAGDSPGVAGNDGVIRLISAPGVVFSKQVVTTKTTTATLTGAEVLTGLLSTTGTSYTVTLPTATELDDAIHPMVGANEAFDFVICNTASGTITLAVGTGSYTTLGLLTVATTLSVRFRFVRTASNTFVIYRA